LSPFDQGSPCYALVWEGLIGRFYYIDSKLNIRAFPNLLYGPGYRFAYTYFFASATPTSTFTGSLDLAGKLAAICGFADKSRMSRDQRAFVDYILNLDVMQKENSGMNTVIDKASMAHSRFYECGVETQCFKNVAQRISDRIFRIFYDFAKNNLRRQYPLLISGGCGLNCAWNTRWRNVGLFSDVFVPPVPNDSGSAIGTAVDAQHYLTGNAKVAWSVYCGPPFLFDCEIPYWIEAGPLDLASLANELFSGQIVPWVQGNCEMGPRSLGNRSLLAAPFEDRMRARINAIKGREQFRPIAPVTLEEEFDAHFRGVPSRYMLHLPKVRNQRLRAVTHVDDSARVQVLGRDDNVALRALLLEFKKLSGVAVLCNTSLNFPGRGFINRLSDIFRFLEAHELGLAVVGQVTYRRK
jgi:hydroxymethyl cephem carbamoyltransferase